MADRHLIQGDIGSDVGLMQHLLNRGGALLTADGSFGAGTVAAVRACQAKGGLSVSGVVDDPTWALLRGLPEPCPDIATAAVNFIAQQEVSSRAYYDAVVTRPDWPGEQSGITIGVGYDLAMEMTFEPDWGELLPVVTLDALRPCLGQRGTETMAEALAGYSIPWDAAWQVFLKRSLPKSLGETRKTFPGFDDLTPLCRGALVSLVYNRGPAMTDDSPGDPRLEMRQILSAVEAHNGAAVPQLLRAMKRLWPNARGLRDRRDAEARLFEEGLTCTGK